MTAPTLDDAAPPDGTAWHTISLDDTLAMQHVDEHVGLATSEAATRRQRYGPNRMTEAEQEPRWRAFLRQYADPMQIVLVVAGIGSFLIQQYGTGLVILGLSLFNAVIGLHQEGKAAAAVAALQKMMIIKARVLRDGEMAVLPAEELVPGDVVSIEAGDVVPADGRIVRAATLEVAEAALTGESLPVSKGVDPVDTPDTPLGDRSDMVYMNTSVTRGSGEFVVTATGMATEVGHISRMLQADSDTKTPLTKQLDKLTDQILIIGGAALVISMVINLARGDEFKVVFTAAVAFAISAIPTGLPAVVTTILSMGTQLLAKAGAIMKRLRSTETLGSTSAINSDKTGTLTLNQMTAVEMALVGRRFSISGSGYSTEGRIKRTAGVDDVALEPFLLPMALASDAVLDQDGGLIGDPTEGALIVLAEKGGIDVVATREQFPRVAELPFDAEYKLMATFHRMKDDHGQDVVRCFVKGAPDQLLARAKDVVGADAAPIPVDDEGKRKYLAENERLGAQGLRVMATARKDFNPATFDPAADLLPLVDGLTMLALVGIVDPPRPAAKAAIATAKSAGIEVRMITGDHAVTAKAIGDQLGIEGRAITGAEFAAMSDDQLVEAIDEIGVIARVSPEDKVRLVDILKRKGHIVAMTGDGVNDAPALKKADIGIAMGITGTEVSKEAAVMILTDDNFATIVNAVSIGRSLYDNLKKYVRFQIGVLLGFIVAFLGASIFNIAGGVPFVPLQSLWINFTTDLFLAIGLGYGAAAAGLMARPPRASDEAILPRPLIAWLAVVGFVMGASTLAVISWGTDPHGLMIARTMGFTTFALSHVFFAVTTKDERRSIFNLDTFADKPLLIAMGAAFAVIILTVTFGPFQRLLQTGDLELEQWLVCIGVALLLVVVSELRKLLVKKPIDEQPAKPAQAPAAIDA